MNEALGGEEYIFDIPNYREQGWTSSLDQVFKMTERRFKVARQLVTTKPWDYFMMVEMGADRLHHVFWQYFDPAHPKFVEGNPYQDAFQRYYRALDAEVGALIETLPDDVIVIVASDHGARPMIGGVQFNEWLVKNGYLAFTEPVTEPTPIAKAPIDWSRTIAWGDGGYYGRLLHQREGPRARRHRRPLDVRGGARRADREARSHARPGRRVRWAPRSSSRRTCTPRSAAWRPT